MSNDFKTYHFAIVDQLENDEDAEVEQKTLDQHELKVMELIDSILELLWEPSQTKRDSDKVEKPDNHARATIKGKIVDRQLDIIDGFVTAIKGDLKNSEAVDVHVFTYYLDKIKRREGKLEGLEKEITSLNDFWGRLERAFHIEHTLLDFRVVISRLMEETKKEPMPLEMWMPIIHGVNLPQIEVSKFDGNIFNWRLFWEQFQAAIHDKQHLRDIDKLTYLQDALNSGPAMYVNWGVDTDSRKLWRSPEVSQGSLRSP